MSDSYWTRKTLSRRTALRAAALAGGGALALSLAGCGGGDDEDGGSGATGDSTSGGGIKTDSVVDIRKGNQGGRLVFQAYADWGGTILARANNLGIHQGASFTHSGLYQMRAGRPGVDRSSTESELDLATAMPEQLPDKITYVVKIRSDAKFQNGRTVTAEDVKYSYERYAFDADSAYKSTMTWLEKVEAVDPTTVRFTTKGLFADFLGAVSTRSEGHILAKEFEESNEAQNKFMGSGAFIMADRQPPTLNAMFKRNPDFYDKPWPYFNEIQVLGTSDTAKKIADFVSKQTHVMYWLFEDDREQVQKARPDAVLFVNGYSGYAAIPRVDIAPFNDKRIRQALSMALNRKQIREATTKGLGEEDQMFTWTYATWGFHKPAQLVGAKYWTQDLQAAKQLASAAGVTSAIDSTLYHWDPTVIGQGLVDQATLVGTQWRSSGLANMKDVQQTFPQTSSTTRVGNFEGMYFGPTGGAGVGSFYPAIGIRNFVWSPPEGVKPPTPNLAHINDPRLSELSDKQRGQLNLEERKQTFKQMEDIESEEQHLIVMSTVNNNWFVDPNLRNTQVPIWMVNGSVHHVKYWWFDKV